jgi:hypothetical protein
MTMPAVNDQLFPNLMDFPDDHRGRPFPTWAMISTRVMELRKRRGLMVALIAVNIGIPVLYLSIRLIMHLAAPKSYGPAGGLRQLHQLGGRRDVHLRVHRGSDVRLHRRFGGP